MASACIAAAGLALALCTTGVSAGKCSYTNGNYVATSNKNIDVTSLAGNNNGDRPKCNEVVPFKVTFGGATGKGTIQLSFDTNGNNGKSAGWNVLPGASISPSDGSTATLGAGDIKTDSTPGGQDLQKAVLQLDLKGTISYTVTVRAQVICPAVCDSSASFSSSIDDKCSPGAKTIPAKVDCGGGSGGDPHIWGYNSEGFYFYGENEHYYAMVHDSDVSLNVRTAPRFADQEKNLRDIVSAGLSVRTPSREHRVGIFNAGEACVMGFDTCHMAPFAVATVLNGKLVPVGLTVDDDIEVAVLNVPHQCKFDHDDFDESSGMYHPEVSEPLRQRRLRAATSPSEGVLGWLASGAITGAPSEYNDFTNECLAFLRGKDLFAPRLDGLLTTVLIKTPVLSLRAESWGFDDPAMSHDSAAFSPANGAVPVMLDLYPQGWTPSSTAHGLLGQTIRAVAPGQSPMQGEEADYIVAGPYATTFRFYP